MASKNVIRDRLALLACALVTYALIAIVGLLLIFQPLARVGFAMLVGAIPVGIGLKRLQLARAARAFRVAHAPEGKDLLVVYSASPVWQSYIDGNWLSRWNERAVVLNRSDPNWQARPETRLWRILAGRYDHTPAADRCTAARSPPHLSVLRRVQGSQAWS